MITVVRVGHFVERTLRYKNVMLNQDLTFTKMNLEAFSQILFWMWNGSWWKDWFFISEYLRKMKIRVTYSITKKRQPMQFVGYHLIYKLIRRKGLWLLISSHHNKNTKYAENISVQTEFFGMMTKYQNNLEKKMSKAITSKNRISRK